jgi:hypothetical protein
VLKNFHDAEDGIIDNKKNQGKNINANINIQIKNKNIIHLGGQKNKNK